MDISKYVPKLCEYRAKLGFDIDVTHAIAMVGGLGLNKEINLLNQKIENSSGMKKIYYKLKNRKLKKFYRESLETIEIYLNSEKEYNRGLFLHYLDIHKNLGRFIPQKISDKMNTLERVDFKNEKKLEQIIKDRYN